MTQYLHISALFLTLLLSVSAVDLCHYNVFNWNFYLNHNKDLLAKGIRTSSSACNHWTKQGADEGRQAHPRFNSTGYCKHYIDIQFNKLCEKGHYSKAVTHYLDIGLNEGRIGNYFEYQYDPKSISSGKLTLSESFIYGTAVSSLIYMNQTEIVNSFDHGREMSWGFWDVAGYNNRFNEAGSKADGTSNHSSSGRYTWDIVNNSYMCTSALPAYWNQTKFFYVYGKKCVYMNDSMYENAMNYTMLFYTSQQHDQFTLECPGLSMPSSFHNVYELDLNRRNYTQLPLPPKGEVRYSKNPIIFESNANVAIGIRFLSHTGLPKGSISYAYYGRTGSLELIDESTRMAALYSTNERVNKSTRIDTAVRIAVGNVEQVAKAL